MANPNQVNTQDIVDLEGEERHFLFVCSANTCRSPLAAVVMRNEVARKLNTDVPGIENYGFLIRSAGPWANRGAGITRESCVVLKEMGYQLPTRGSRELTVDLITDAAQIYAMTRWHIDQVLALNGQARVKLLDATGRDIPDPIGSGIETYRQVGRIIQSSVQQIVADLFKA